ncbi:MAG: methylenetetrahydrofolate--tRNA-(uracil(54)-C(5))-methyltransferase (FADH(2)-oxidizing) TrmFO [Thermodesulfobacteriota bacterium]|nr:methylenetetrahydrofolate--tRNA-(uracil(54)-C(5))-methyltransferase (FADH(2)-oxidizing) TrmFO [Thermodesulfobacteriota bacterium]
MRDSREIIIIGGGLAGCEAAWHAAKNGMNVVLYEMKPTSFSSAHRSKNLGELVCSNSLKSESLESASGLLKEEMKRLGSLILKAAYASRVPGGSALVVDRDQFSSYITEAIESETNICVVREEVSKISLDKAHIIASGPLSSESLTDEIKRLTGADNLSFYDAIAPIVAGDSINMDNIFMASRYNKGGNDYINCPLTRDEYFQFIEAVEEADKVDLESFEDPHYFEGCVPIEELVRRGKETLLFGPMKPVGLIDPKTGREPFAVAQLRKENVDGTMYNMVGFQTKMKWSEQNRVLRMIPGLEAAEFLRFGSLHRNTFINAPRLLLPTLQMKGVASTFFAGQIVGVEGYLESAAMGILAGINCSRYCLGHDIIIPPPTTAIGSLLSYITQCESQCFQPMNMNFGLFPQFPNRVKKRHKKLMIVERAIRDLEEWIKRLQEVKD